MEETYGSPAAAPVEETYGFPAAAPVEETYGSPAAAPLYESPAEETYGSPVAGPVAGNNYGSPPLSSPSPVYSPPPPLVFSEDLQKGTATDNSIHNLSIPDVKHEPVIHPGGGDAKEHLDVHLVEVLGAQSVVQVSSPFIIMIYALFKLVQFAPGHHLKSSMYDLTGLGSYLNAILLSEGRQCFI